MAELEKAPAAEIEETPAAKFVAINEIKTLQAASSAATLVNRGLSTALIISFAFISSKGSNIPFILQSLPGFTGLVIQLSWLLHEIASMFQLRRAYYRLALVDSSRYSTDWEDKFVGLRIGQFSKSTYANIIEPPLWALVFVLLLLQNYQRIERPMYDRAEVEFRTHMVDESRTAAYRVLLDRANMSKFQFDADALRREFRERFQLNMELPTADLSAVASLRELSLKYYGDAEYWPLIRWVNGAEFPDVEKVNGDTDPHRARPLTTKPVGKPDAGDPDLHIVKFIGWPEFVAESFPR
jgi:hypothetical protein